MILFLSFIPNLLQTLLKAEQDVLTAKITVHFIGLSFLHYDAIWMRWSFLRPTKNGACLVQLCQFFLLKCLESLATRTLIGKSIQTIP